MRRMPGGSPNGFAQTDPRCRWQGSIAGKVASKPHAPVCMTKQTVNAIAKAFDQTASHMDRDQFLLSVSNDESRERIASFLDRTKAPGKGIDP